MTEWTKERIENEIKSTEGKTGVLVTTDSHYLEVLQDLLRLRSELDKHKWIPVSERLPEVNEQVLVSYENTCCESIVTVAQMRDNGLYETDPNVFLDRNFEVVTHWMPLPEPPEAL